MHVTEIQLAEHNKTLIGTLFKLLKWLLYSMAIDKNNLQNLSNKLIIQYVVFVTLTHLFWECNKIQQLFQYLRDYIQNFDNFLCCKTFILGSEKTDFEYDILFFKNEKIHLFVKNKKHSTFMHWFQKKFKNTNMSEKENKRWPIVRTLIN